LRVADGAGVYGEWHDGIAGGSGRLYHSRVATGERELFGGGERRSELQRDGGSADDYIWGAEQSGAERGVVHGERDGVEWLGGKLHFDDERVYGEWDDGDSGSCGHLY